MQNTGGNSPSGLSVINTSVNHDGAADGPPLAIIAATPRTVGSANIHVNSNGRPVCSRNRLHTCTADNELPPDSKNDAVALTWSTATPSTCANTSATTNSPHPREPHNRRPTPRNPGPATPDDPTSRPAAHELLDHHPHRGHHVGRQRLSHRGLDDFEINRRPTRRRHITHHMLRTARPLGNSGHRIPHPAPPRARLPPRPTRYATPDLHLVIATSEVLISPSALTRTMSPVAYIRAPVAPNGSATNAPAVSPGRPR